MKMEVVGKTPLKPWTIYLRYMAQNTARRCAEDRRSIVRLARARKHLEKGVQLEGSFCRGSIILPFTGSLSKFLLFWVESVN